MKGNGNGTRRPQEIQREIDRTRGELDATLNAIEHRLTPGQLLDQGIDYLRHSGARQYLTNLGGSLKDNPIPVTLAGIGLAWLAAMQNRPVQYRFVEVERKEYEEYPAYDETPGAIDKARDKMHQASDRVSQMRNRMSSQASHLTESARQQAERVKGGWDTMRNDHPLALGAIGLALGAVAAAMQPRTRKEDEMMGATRDRLLDDAKQVGAEKLQQAQQLAKEAVGAPQKGDGGARSPF
jgi:hypothetical protein